MAAKAADMAPVVRRLNRKPAQDLLRVLARLGIPHHSEQIGRKVDIWVAAPYLPFAKRQLARRMAQERSAPDDSPADTALTALWSSLIVTGGLMLIHVLVERQAAGALLFEDLGAMDRLIRSGELYRCVTALLLHKDAAHLLSNLAALILFGPFVCRRFGHGWGWLLVLMGGAGGNWLNAIVRQAPQLGMGPHLSVGASTAVFGAVGILVADNLNRRRRQEGQGWRQWTPIAGGLGFLAFMGSAPGTDLLAHLFGFLAGLAVGGVAAFCGPRRSFGWGQALATAAALATLVWTWSRGMGQW